MNFWDSISSLVSGENNGSNKVLGMDSNNFATLAGGLAQAIAGKDSAAGQVGAMAAQRGQSGILNKQRQSQSDEYKRMLMSLIAGVTPQGSPGPTEVKVTSDGFNVKGDGPAIDGTNPGGSVIPSSSKEAAQSFSPFLQALMR